MKKTDTGIPDCAVTGMDRNLYTAWQAINSGMAGSFSVVILAVFPLVYRDYYFDILNYKTEFYYKSVLIFAAVFVLVNAVIAFLAAYLNRGAVRLGGPRLKAADWAMLAFVSAAILSTIQSDYAEAALWGGEGRFSGLILIAAYGFTYFAISRNLKLRQWYLDLFLGAGMLACIMGILQYFKMDPLGFKRQMDPVQYPMFTSTIGNINTYTSYIAMVVGMSAVLFYLERGRVRKICYLFSFIISLFALITGISDNAYLALLALLAIFPFYGFKTVKGVRDYCVMVAVLCSEFWLIDWIIRTWPGSTLEISGLFQVISGFPGLAYIAAGLWILCAGLYLTPHRLLPERFLRGKYGGGRWIWALVLGVALLGASVALYDVNVLGNGERYGGLAAYLRINDDWGTHRWYNWRIGMESFRQFPLIHKLFGSGPDTYGIVTINGYYDEMVNRYGEIFDNAHNEYLQYLVTMGAVGLAAYVSLLVLAVREMIRNAKEKPYVMAIVFAVICYGAQAAVNISVPIVTPVMMTLLMMGVSPGSGRKRA